MNNSDLQQEIERLIQSLGKNCKIVGSHNTRLACKIEKRLKVVLPESFIWFLVHYGFLMIPGFMIQGGGHGKEPVCVALTTSHRQYGLPDHLLVFEAEGDEAAFLLDLSRIKDGDCPVVCMELDTNTFFDYSPGFYQFLIDRVNQAIDLLKEDPDWFKE